jgi:hypothetical protein
VPWPWRHESDGIFVDRRRSGARQNREVAMAKGQKKSNKEIRKPKQPKPAAAPGGKKK